MSVRLSARCMALPEARGVLSNDRSSQAMLADCGDIILNGGDEAVTMRRFHQIREIVGIDVDGFAFEAIGDLFSLDQQELVRFGKFGIQRLYFRKHIVIAEDEKLVAILLIPAGDYGGRRIAVAVQRMGMQVALIPAAGRRLCCRGTPQEQSRDGGRRGAEQLRLSKMSHG